MISAGPTREWIDPVRYLSNPSSGKMGYALAEVARDMGMMVKLVSGPVNIPAPEGVKVIGVESAIDMKDAILAEFEKADLVIMAAAVSDHRPEAFSNRKWTKEEFPEQLRMVRNPDILKLLGEAKKEGQVLVGFAAETHDVLPSAKRKLADKKLDWIVANDVSKSDCGFASDQNEVLLVGRNGFEKEIYLADKRVIAKEILHAIQSSWLEKAL